MRRFVIVLLAAATGAAVFGCKKSDSKPADQQAAPSASAEEKAGKDPQKRLDEALKK
jgi:hypothetical protein